MFRIFCSTFINIKHLKLTNVTSLKLQENSGQGKKIFVRRHNGQSFAIEQLCFCWRSFAKSPYLNLFLLDEQQTVPVHLPEVLDGAAAAGKLVVGIVLRHHNSIAVPANNNLISNLATHSSAGPDLSIQLFFLKVFVRIWGL